MSNFYENDCEFHEEEFESITGNVLDLELNKCDSEVRADVKVGKNKKKCIRVWGQIKDCEGKPVKEALVKLLKTHFCHGKVQYEGIAHTTTDCLGFYQFDVCICDEKAKFRIIVGKANKGKERVVHGKEICKPCEEEHDCDNDQEHDCDHN